MMTKYVVIQGILPSNSISHNLVTLVPILGYEVRVLPYSLYGAKRLMGLNRFDYKVVFFFNL